MLEYYRDLAQQLVAMPGGHTKLREAYFGSLTLPVRIPADLLLSRRIIEGWMLHEDGVLALASGEHNDASLIWLSKDGEEILACFSSELQKAAREYAVTPLGLALLVLAMGGADDSRLKKLLPALHKASKELLLIAVCRLCG